MAAAGVMYSSAGAAAPPVAGYKRTAAPTTVEELIAALAAAKAAAAATEACVAEARRARVAAEARAAEERREREAAEARAVIAEAREAEETLKVFAADLLGTATLRATAHATPSGDTGRGGALLLGHEVRCDDALRALCSEDGAAAADLVAAKSAVADSGLAALAVELARVPPNERNERSVQRVMNGYLAAVVRAVLPDASWVPEAKLSTALRTDGEARGLYYCADGALLPRQERHANVVTTQLSAAYTRPIAWKGLVAGRRQAAIRLAHLLLVKYYELHPRPAALPAGRLAAYSLVADGFQLYVVCVEVAYDARRQPRLVCSQHGPLPLWGAALMEYAARGEREGGVAPAPGDCYDAHAPGLVAVVKLLRAGRAVLGDVAFTVPAGLAFSMPLPPPREWIHLGSGGASETYSTVAAGGRFVVVKVARQPGASWQPLAVEEAAYAALGAHGTTCAAIPVLAGTAAAPDGKGVAALVLSAGDGSEETVPVEEVLAAAGDRIVTALTVAWCAVVALQHAHGAGVVHRDVRGANTVWKVGAVLPTASEVAAAIAAAEAAAGAGDSSGVVEAALGLLPPPPAQLVDWGVATIHTVPTATDADTAAAAATDTAAEALSSGVAEDVCRLHTRLLPSLLDADGCSVAELAARLRGPPAEVECHMHALAAASSAVEALLPVLRLLHLALLTDNSVAGAPSVGS